nr:hevamine-A-like [Ziziphus jujuba var. spinosa]
MVQQAKLAVACLILTLALMAQISEAANGASITQFGDGNDLVLNLAGHCTPPDCTHIGEQIKTCQVLHGVKIFISLGGENGNYNLTSPEDAKHVADQLWDSYLGGTYSTATRPFGDAVLDGVDFDLVGSNTKYDADLAYYLKAINQQGIKPVYLSAAPQCPYPDYYLQNALDTGLFDYVWVQFYDNSPCEYSNVTGIAGLLSAWNTWTSKLKGSGKLFLGVPASIDAASTGYIPADVLNNEILPLIKATPKYGGVMVWNRYYDRLSNYSFAIIDFVKLKNNQQLPTMRMYQYE